MQRGDASFRLNMTQAEDFAALEATVYCDVRALPSLPQNNALIFDHVQLQTPACETHVSSRSTCSRS